MKFSIVNLSHGSSPHLWSRPAFNLLKTFTSPVSAAVLESIHVLYSIRGVPFWFDEVTPLLLEGRTPYQHWDTMKVLLDTSCFITQCLTRLDPFPENGRYL